MATGKLYNIGHISSSKVSGGTLVFNSISSPAAANLTATALNTLTLGAGSDAGLLHTHTGLSASPGGPMTANVGANDDYGISGLAWISSSKTYSPNYVGTWQGDVIGDAYIANDITLTNLTQITTKSHTVLSDIGTRTHDALETDLTAWGGSSQKIKNASDWYVASSMKLSESGAKYSDLYTWYGTTVSSQQYSNWLASGHKLSTWFKESSMKISESFANSGEKTWDAWKWYNVSSAQFGNWLASGEKLSRFFSESSQILGNLIAGYAPSRATKKGWSQIADAGTITHGLGVKPQWAQLAPSGTSPLAFSFVLSNDTTITVYHTSPDLETFSWEVQTWPQVVA